MRASLASFNIMILFLIFGPAASADIYGYVDKDGDYHFTNMPMDSRYKLWLREQRSYSPDHEARLSEPHIRKASQLFGVDPALIKAVIRVESNFNPHAVSPAGALGIMQLMPETATRLGVDNVFDMESNIHGGTQYLKDLLRTFNGNVGLSLAAYNIGENTVKRCKGIPPVKQTQDFVRKVLQWYRAYRQEGDRERTRRGAEDIRI